jgi:hypothetical protein
VGSLNVGLGGLNKELIEQKSEGRHDCVESRTMSRIEF